MDYLKILKIKLEDINNYRNIIEDIKPMLNKNYLAELEIKVRETMSGKLVKDYYLIIKPNKCNSKRKNNYKFVDDEIHKLYYPELTRIFNLR